MRSLRLRSWILRATIAGVLAVPAIALAAGEVVLVTTGGDFAKRFTKALVDPAARESDVKVRQESFNLLPGVRLQVASGSPAWDLVNMSCELMERGAKENLWEKLDYSKIATAGIPKQYVNPYWVGVSYFSVVLAARTANGRKVPTNWAEFWDVKNFPGRRSLPSFAQDNLEIALMADGVKPENLYPLDIPRAIRSLERIKPHVAVWWKSGAQSAQLLKDGEVDMSAVWTSAGSAAKEAGAPIALNYNQGIIAAGCLAVPRGSKNVAAANSLIGKMLTPAIQANVPVDMGYYGPINDDAFKVKPIPKEYLEISSSSPANMAKQVKLDAAWWAANGTKADEAFQAFLAR